MIAAPFHRIVISEKFQRWSGREQNVVETDGPALKQNLTGLGRIEGKPEFHDVKCDVLVERVQDQSAHSIVIRRAVDQ